MASYEKNDGFHVVGGRIDAGWVWRFEMDRYGTFTY